MRLLTQGQTGQIYNVCSGQPHTLQHVVNTLERITGHTMAVDVNPAFVRANEVHRLSGSSTKLQAAVGPLGEWGLEDTLRWMMNENCF